MEDEQETTVGLLRTGKRRGQLQRMRHQSSMTNSGSDHGYLSLMADRPVASLKLSRRTTPNAWSPPSEVVEHPRLELLRMPTIDYNRQVSIDDDSSMDAASRRLSFPLSYAAISRISEEQVAQRKANTDASRCRGKVNVESKSQMSFDFGPGFHLSIDDESDSPRARRASMGGRPGAGTNPRLLQKRLRVQALKVAQRAKIVAMVKEQQTAEKKLQRKFTANELRRMFCRAGRILCILVQFCNTIRQQALERTAVTALQLQFQSLQGQSGPDGNRWNKYADHCVPLWAREIARKPYDSRTTEDCQKLHGLLGRLHSFAEKFSLEAQQLLCRSVYYMRLNSGRVVLREGHRGETAYFILSGSVFINVHDFDPMTKSKFSRTVTVLKQGDSIGEIALIRPGTRNATVITREPTELMVVERDIFLQNSPEIFQAEFAKKVKFARTMRLLSNWPEDMLESMCMESTIKEYKPGLVIEKDTLKSKSVYLITDGACDVLRCLDIREAARLSSERAILEEKRKLLTSIWVHDEAKPSIGEQAARQAWREAEPVWRQMLSSSPGGKKVFIRVNTLLKEDCCDLTCLVSPDAVPLILISKGVKLLCIPKRALKTFAPQDFWKELKDLGTSSSFCPPDSELFQHYLKEHSWSYYKEAVVHDVISRRYGCSQVDKPVTLKGRTGWTRWPGRSITSRPPSVATRSRCQSEFDERDSDILLPSSCITATESPCFAK